MTYRAFGGKDSDGGQWWVLTGPDLTACKVIAAMNGHTVKQHSKSTRWICSRCMKFMDMRYDPGPDTPARYMEASRQPCPTNP